MTDDPREVLKAACVECAEVDDWQTAQLWASDMSEEKVFQAKLTILALARLVAALQARRCEGCEHAKGNSRWEAPTFEKDGYAICSKVVFNSEPFWDGDDAHWDRKTDKPVAAAWVVDASDYWAALHVTPDFYCSGWAERTTP